MGESLEGELDVDERGERLDGTIVLGMVEEVAHARQQIWMPFENVKLIVREGL